MLKFLYFPCKNSLFIIRRFSVTVGKILKHYRKKKDPEGFILFIICEHVVMLSVYVFTLRVLERYFIDEILVMNKIFQFKNLLVLKSV